MQKLEVSGLGIHRGFSPSQRRKGGRKNVGEGKGAEYEVNITLLINLNK